MSTKRELKKVMSPAQIYSEGFKRQVVIEFEQGLYTKASLERRYLIRGHGNINHYFQKNFKNTIFVNNPDNRFQTIYIVDVYSDILHIQVKKKEYATFVFGPFRFLLKYQR